MSEAAGPPTAISAQEIESILPHRFPFLLVDRVREISEEKDATPAQLALAWVLRRGEDIVPIPGTKRRTYLEQNAATADVELTADDLSRIDAELPETVGERYDEAGMASVNR